MAIELVTRPKLVNEDVIKRLEEALEMAHAGRLAGVAVAYVTNDGASGTGFSRCESHARLLGAVTLLQHRICVDT